VNDILSDVSPNQYFHLKDGKSIKNLLELATALRTMDDNVFFHHVNNKRNDFANWIRDVVGDDKLAYKVFKQKNKHDIRVLIEKRILKLKNPGKVRKSIHKIKNKSLNKIKPTLRIMKKHKPKIRQPRKHKISRKVKTSYNKEPIIHKSTLKSFLIGTIIGLVSVMIVFLIFYIL